MQQSPIPQNIEAESGILGSILIDSEALDLVIDFLYPEDFYRDAHQTIYAAMKLLYERREPVDILTLCDEMERVGTLDEVGGGSYLTSLVNCVPTSGNIEYYGHIVERTAILRRLMHAAGQIAALASTEPNATSAVARAEEIIYNLSRRDRVTDAVSVGEVFGEFADWFERMPVGGAIVGVPTGLTPLDLLTGGLQRSDLIVIAGRPAMGKTSLALSTSLKATKDYGRGVLFFSAEMSRLQLYQRAVAHETHINLHRLRMGQLSEWEREKVSDEAVAISQLPLYIDHTPAISIASMRSKIRRMLRSHDIDLIVVDYLQKLTATDADGKRYREDYKEVSEIARGLKDMAREFNLPILALAQLSRAVESRSEHIPQLSDLAKSGAIEQEADIVAFIYRDDYYNKQSQRPGTADIIFAKNRNGPCKEITVGFEATETRFYDLATATVESNLEEVPS